MTSSHTPDQGQNPDQAQPPFLQSDDRYEPFDEMTGTSRGTRARMVTQAARLWRYRTVALVAVMAVVACVGFAGVFAGWSHLVVTVLAVAGATGCAIAGLRWRLLLSEAIVLNTLAFVVVGIAVTQWVPGPAAPADFAAALARGWAELLSSQSPAELTGRLAPVPFTTAWVAAALAHELDRRVHWSGIALVGALVGLVTTSLFSAEVPTLARYQGGLLVVLTVLIARVHRHEAELDVGLSVSSMRRPGLSKLAMPAAVLALVGVSAAVVGPRLPLADANERFDLRDLQENPWDPLDAPSPLVTLKADLKEGARDEVAFRVTSERPITRWTTAVLSTYDGVVWHVADPLIGGAAQFVPVDPTLPELARPVESLAVRATLEIVDLDGPWVPHAGLPIEASFVGDDANLRLNLETATLARPGGHRSGDRYELVTALHPTSDARGIEQAQFDVAGSATELDLVPAPILNLAAELVEGQDLGGAQVAAIRDRFTLEGFYDAGRERPPGHSYAQIARFVDDPTRLVGYEEQYAAAAGVLARIAGIPTRVAVGYNIPEDRYRGGVAEVLAGDATAWIEVNVAGAGWVPVDVTPDRSREPTDQEPGRIRQNVAIPNEPPPPPPPFESEDLDEEEALDDEDENEETAEGRSWFRALVDRPGLVAGGIAVSPLIGFGLLGLLAALVRLRRVRRRRGADGTDERIVGAWAELVDRLTESGHDVPVNATPLEVVEGLADDDRSAGAAADARQVADLVSRAAFAPRPPSSDDAERAWRHTDAASTAAREQLGVWERLRMWADVRSAVRNPRRTSVSNAVVDIAETHESPDRTPEVVA